MSDTLLPIGTNVRFTYDDDGGKFFDGETGVISGYWGGTPHPNGPFPYYVSLDYSDDLLLVGPDEFEVDTDYDGDEPDIRIPLLPVGTEVTMRNGHPGGQYRKGDHATITGYWDDDPYNKAGVPYPYYVTVYGESGALVMNEDGFEVNETDDEEPVVPTTDEENEECVTITLHVFAVLTRSV